MFTVFTMQIPIRIIDVSLLSYNLRTKCNFTTHFGTSTFWQLRNLEALCYGTLPAAQSIYHEKWLTASTPMPAPKFPLPDEVKVPKGAEGWEELYPYLGLFSKKKGDYKRFWFQDNLHFPLPLTPFEAGILTQYHPAPIGSYNSRVWPIPAALGPFYRVFAGFIFISSENITDQAEVKRRAAMFRRRAGYYFEHWEEVLEKWRKKTQGLIEEFRSIEFKTLPEFEPEESVLQGRGLTAGYDLIELYDRLMLLWEKSWYYHFEMFIAYGSALAFADVANTLFPGISNKTVFAMIAGIKSPLWAPDEKLKHLAKLSIQLGVADLIARGRSPEYLFKELRRTA